MKNSLEFPVFLKVAEYAQTDLFWNRIYMDFAYGVLPYGVVINDGVVYKKNRLHYSFEGKSPSLIFTELTQLMQSKLDLSSKLDRLSDQYIYHQMEWKDIKKKNIKELFIENYVLTLKNKYALSVKQTQLMHRFLVIQMCFRQISGSHICYDPEQAIITQISNLRIKKSKRTLRISIEAD
jgi:hypothetical protein